MPNYTKPYSYKRGRGRQGKLKKFDAPLPTVRKAVTKQSVATPAYVRKAVRKALRTYNETKHIIFAETRQALYHNGGTNGVSGAFQTNLMATNKMPGAGDGESNRDGNVIQLRGYRLQGIITFPFDRLASKVIMMLVRVPKGYNVLSGYASLFDNVSQNWLLDNVDTGRVKVLKKKIFQLGKSLNPTPPQNNTVREITLPFKYYIKYPTRLTFLDDNSNDHTHPYDVVMVWASYDAWGSLSTDITAYVKLDIKTYYKDI